MCMVHADNCYCDRLKSITISTKVSFIIYKKEKFLPSNTANLALNCLTNSKVFYRGYKDEQLGKDFLEEPEYLPLLLYPSDEAIELTPQYLNTIDKPINLIVPDGTWRQAKKVHMREKVLQGVQAVKLSSPPKSQYPLRRQKFEYGLCTFEATAFALGAIHGGNIQNELLDNFKLMIDSHLLNRVILEKEKPLN